MLYDHDHNHNKQNNIKMAFLLNLFFTILEIFGGLWTNSMAILSDALHDLGDSFSLGIAWYLERYSEKKPDQNFSFGYARFSLLGALINSMIIIGGSTLILSRAIPRLITPEPVHPEGMILFALIGITINGIAVIRLRRGHSLNEKVVSWHLLEDVLGWVVVLIASVILLFIDLPIIDPILSILITIFVLYNVLKNLKSILNVFLQGVPSHLSVSEIENHLEVHHEIMSAHHTHVWSMDGEKIFLSTHIVLRDDIPRDEIIKIKNEVKDVLHEKGITHITIEIDYESDDCIDQNCH